MKTYENFYNKNRINSLHSELSCESISNLVTAFLKNIQTGIVSY